MRSVVGKEDDDNSENLEWTVEVGDCALYQVEECLFR